MTMLQHAQPTCNIFFCQKRQLSSSTSYVLTTKALLTRSNTVRFVCLILKDKNNTQFSLFPKYLTRVALEFEPKPRLVQSLQSNKTFRIQGTNNWIQKTTGRQLLLNSNICLAYYSRHYS